MSFLDRQDVLQALDVFADLGTEREIQLDNYSPTREKEDSHGENDSSLPILDMSVESEVAEAIKKMKNFTIMEFDKLWTMFGDFITTYYNVARGSKS